MVSGENTARIIENVLFLGTTILVKEKVILKNGIEALVQRLNENGCEMRSTNSWRLFSMATKFCIMAPNSAASPELASFHSSGVCKFEEASDCVVHHTHLTG